MSNVFRFLADEEKLTDELFAFITDPDADNRSQWRQLRLTTTGARISAKHLSENPLLALH